ncbi:MAG: heme ABC transporter ATP-binding protein [Deltaproteobacteria bacterium]|nr:heme ABC transporter ATP-binding protein [Deltaproteobacteria bacterium]
MTAAIDARGVTVRAGRATLVDGVDLTVAAGELVAIVGPNGAGKSTLLGAIAGDRALAAGRVMLGGRDVRDLSIAELARRRAVLRQRTNLTLAFTACEVVELAGVSPRTAREHLATVELADFADRSYPTLSGGEQQRVQLARVLAQLAQMPHRGAALLLDEPTAALDPRHQQVVLRIARDVAAAGRAVVAVLHDLPLAARTCDRALLLAAGRTVALGPAADTLVPDLLAEAYGTRFAVISAVAPV